MLPSYNAGTATLTLNLFEKLKSKPPLDLSEYISDTEVDYQEFISDYGQTSGYPIQKLNTSNLKPITKASS